MPSRTTERLRPAALLLCLLLLAGCRGDATRGRAERGAIADPALHALVDTMLPSVARLASLPVRDSVHVERRDSAQVRRYVESRLDAEMPAALLHSIRDVYALLGLVPDSLDLRALLLQLYTEQIVGYYDPAQRTLYVVEGVAPQTVTPVLAHELVHALQDQYVNLDSAISRERGNDAQSAAHAAFEGHATVTMFAYLAEQAQQRRLDPALLPSPAPALAQGLRAQNEQFPVFRDAPRILRETMLFPYIAGAEFMHQLWRAKPRDRPAPVGYWLPQSTEQVLHPRRGFFGLRDEPTPLRIAVGSEPGWQPAAPDDGLGEAETGSFLAQHLGEDARRFAEGWDGDAWRLLENAQGQRALLWYSVWDDAAAADAFAAAVRRVGARLTARRIEVQRSELGGRPFVRVLAGGRNIGFPARLPPPTFATGR